MPRSVPPKFILILWPAADRFLRMIEHIRPLRVDDSGIVRLSVRRYTGPARELNDGSEAKTGNTIIELHLCNAWFIRRRNLSLKASQAPREFLSCFAQDLCFIAERMVSGEFSNVTAPWHHPLGCSRQTIGIPG